MCVGVLLNLKRIAAVHAAIGSWMTDKQEVTFSRFQVYSDDVVPKSSWGKCEAEGPRSPFPVGRQTGTCIRWLESGREPPRSEEHTSELQSLRHLVCRL